MKSYFLTDIGNKRKANQDYVFCSDEPIGNLPNLYIVADGMGGHKAGDYASRVCTQTILHSIEHCTEYVTPVSILDNAIKNANKQIIKDAKDNPDLEGMGTTLVAATVIDGVMYVANIGDSRLYVVNHEDYEIIQVTEDHSLVEEMIKRGEIERKDARFHPNKNIITRALGAHDDVVADFFEIELEQGDVLLLCSDGLSNMISDEELLETVCKEKDNCDVAVAKLVAKANQYGGKDNITVALVTI